MYVPQLTGFEPYPSAHVGEISHMVILGTIPIDSHSKMVLFQMVIEKNLFMCRAGEELKRRCEIAYQKITNHRVDKHSLLA